MSHRASLSLFFATGRRYQVLRPDFETSLIRRADADNVLLQGEGAPGKLDQRLAVAGNFGQIDRQTLRPTLQFGGRWGDQKHVDRFLQADAIEKCRIDARKKGHTMTEQALADGPASG